jgi:hypothetical protein
VRREDSRVALAHLQQFLLARGWQQGRSGKRVDEYAPPSDLALPPDFKIAVPRTAEPPDVPRLLSTIASTLADLYMCTVDQIAPVIEKADAVFTMTVSSEATESGSIALSSLSGIIGELRNLILNTTAFVAEEDPVVDRIPPEAYDYVDHCRFLQTTKGSFGASIQLPTEEIVNLRSEVNPDGVRGQAIVDRITRVLSFVSKSVMQRQDELFTAEHLHAHSDVINVNVLENIRDLCEDVGIGTVGFSVIGVRDSNDVSLGTLTPEKTAAMAAYIRFLRRAVAETVAIDASGPILELRSRNPEGNRNYIRIEIEFEGKPIFLAATVDNARYALAVRAHRAGHAVHLVGRARRMKTQLKMTTIESFGEA